MGGFGGYKVIGYKNLNSLNAELNTVMLRRKKEEVLDLPPKLYSTEYVELTTAQKKQYRDIKNGIVADMENILASVNPLNCTLRLRQLTSGNPNLTDDSPKLDRIKEMLEEEIIPNGHKAIIFSQWSTIAKDLGIELREYDPIVITGEVPPEQRQKLVDNFQTNPHCKVAIGTIGAMGTGLTLNKELATEVKDTLTVLLISIVVLLMPLFAYVAMGATWLSTILPSAGIGMQNNFLSQLADFNYLNIGGMSFWTPHVILISAGIELFVFTFLAIHSYCRHQVA